MFPFSRFPDFENASNDVNKESSSSPSVDALDENNTTQAVSDSSTDHKLLQSAANSSSTLLNIEGDGDVADETPEKVEEGKQEDSAVLHEEFDEDEWKKAVEEDCLDDLKMLETAVTAYADALASRDDRKDIFWHHELMHNVVLGNTMTFGLGFANGRWGGHQVPEGLIPTARATMCYTVPLAWRAFPSLSNRKGDETVANWCRAVKREN
ncbi:hypothetical protein V5O48_008097 [Marasmius crinis-equi]|uniref:Uncharacterized protein n=1 Tax=Marasmius crinis-equi TaxID=585013 RepID=A0ABR3FEZ5_9AGAR